MEVVAFDLGLKGWVSPPLGSRVGVGTAFRAEPVASEEMWKQENQACLEEEQVVLTGWSTG